MMTTCATLTPTSSAASATSRVSADERTIIRVAQPMSPSTKPPTTSTTTLELAEQVKKDLAIPASPNGDQPPPGMSPLDYVKNKIVEEMKKHGEDGLPMATSLIPSSLLPNLKRSSPEIAAAAGGCTMEDGQKGPKRAKLEDEAVTIMNSGNAPAADSPGSPGDMVIDESDITPKAASPVVSASEATPTATPTTHAATPSSAAATVTANSSKYEPLSDDE